MSPAKSREVSTVTRRFGTATAAVHEKPGLLRQTRLAATARSAEFHFRIAEPLATCSIRFQRLAHSPRELMPPPRRAV